MEQPVDILSEADPDTERRLGAFPNPPLDECPVVPLGFDGPRLIFAMPEGEIRIELASKIGSMLRTDIMACEAGQSFLVYWRDGDDKFQRDLATVWFVRRCRAAGKWDSRRVQRSLGVWPGGAGEVVLHRGGEIWRYGPDGGVDVVSIVNALRDRSGPIYLLRPPAPRPGEAIAAADGAWIRSHLNRWRFNEIGDDGLTGADLVMGWIGSAMLGAVAPFRGHLLINALPGSGKTTLLAFIEALVSALAGDVINSFTEAGFRAEITGMARPALIDEAEASGGDHGPGPVEMVLGYLRLMATGAGANRKQVGSDAGQGAQTAVGSVLMAAASPPKLDSALATRVAEVKLLPLNRSDLPEDEPGPEMATDEQLADAVKRARKLAPGLLARVLESAGRYREDVALIKAALLRAHQSARTADLVAMMAAGRRLLMDDDPLTPMSAEAEVAFWTPLLDMRERAEAVTNPGADALAFLLHTDSGLQQTQRKSLGELIESELAGEKAYPEILKAHGLRVYLGPGKDGREGPWLLIANHHPGLDRIFARSPWGDHRKTLEYLDALGPEHQTWPTKPMWFGLAKKSRALAVPLTPWLEKPIRVPAAVPGSVPGEAYDF